MSCGGEEIVEGDEASVGGPEEAPRRWIAIGDDARLDGADDGAAVGRDRERLAQVVVLFPPELRKDREPAGERPDVRRLVAVERERAGGGGGGRVDRGHGGYGRAGRRCSDVRRAARVPADQS